MSVAGLENAGVQESYGQSIIGATLKRRDGSGCRAGEVAVGDGISLGHALDGARRQAAGRRWKGRWAPVYQARGDSSDSIDDKVLGRLISDGETQSMDDERQSA